MADLREEIAALVGEHVGERREALRLADEILHVIEHATLPDDLLACQEPVQPHTGWEYGVSSVNFFGKESMIVPTEQSLARSFGQEPVQETYRLYRRRPAGEWERIKKVPLRRSRGS